MRLPPEGLGLGCSFLGIALHQLISPSWGVQTTQLISVRGGNASGCTFHLPHALVEFEQFDYVEGGLDLRIIRAKKIPRFLTKLGCHRDMFAICVGGSR